MLKFDATDLPLIPFEASYPKDFRGRPEVDLVSPVWRPRPSKVRKPRFVQQKIDQFEFLYKTNYPGKMVNFCLKDEYIS